MKNSTAAAAKKRSKSSEGVAEPPAKRPSNNVAAEFPSGYELTPELIGQIAHFLPMGTPDMMRLLLRFGPHVAAVVRKMYLTGNDYYLGYYMYGFNWYRRSRARDCIGYWMDYNEKAWKKRCLGKKHKDNVHSVMLTPEQFRSLEFGRLSDLITVKPSYSTSESMNVLKKLVKNNPFLFLISVGDKDIDDGRHMTEEERNALVDSAPIDSDGNLCVRFMRSSDALIAYPKIFLMYDLVDVLRYMIEEKVIKSDMMISAEDVDGERTGVSLLYLAVMNNSANSFRYLLSLPGTDINAVASSIVNDYDHRIYDNIIHVCLRGRIFPSYLEGVIAHPDVDLNLRNSHGETALCAGCKLLGFEITKLRLLLKAGADPRIEDQDGYSPLFSIIDRISNTLWSDRNSELKAKLVQLQKEITHRIQELNSMGAQST